MKKILIVILAGLVMAVFAGCSGTTPPRTGDSNTEQAGEELQLPDEQAAGEQPDDADGQQPDDGETGNQPDDAQKEPEEKDKPLEPDIIDENFAIDIAYDILEEAGVIPDPEIYGEPDAQLLKVDGVLSWLISFTPNLDSGSHGIYSVQIEAETGLVIKTDMADIGGLPANAQDEKEPQAQTDSTEDVDETEDTTEEE